MRKRGEKKMTRQRQIELMQDIAGASFWFGMVCAGMSVVMARLGAFEIGFGFVGIVTICMIVWNICSEIADQRIDSEKRKERKRDQ